MKTIKLLRHAQSQRGGASTDKKRTLTADGRADADNIGQFLNQKNISVDHIESSTARRARETTTLITKGKGLDFEVSWNDNFYSGGPGDYHEVIQQAPEDVDDILLVGHNPSVSNLVSRLCSSGQEYLVRMPQGGLVCIEHPAMHWYQVEAGTARLRWMVTPELL